MARKPKELTPKAKAAKAAAEAYDKARDIHAKSTTPANLKAVGEAKKHLDAANAELARERFETIAGGRVTTAITALNALAKCANRKSYQFHADDVAKIDAALNEAVSACTDAFDKALNTPATSSAGKPEPFRF